jgi:hypothetical protein
MLFDHGKEVTLIHGKVPWLNCQWTTKKKSGTGGTPRQHVTTILTRQHAAKLHRHLHKQHQPFFSKLEEL